MTIKYDMDNLGLAFLIGLNLLFIQITKIDIGIFDVSSYKNEIATTIGTFYYYNKYGKNKKWQQNVIPTLTSIGFGIIMGLGFEFIAEFIFKITDWRAVMFLYGCAGAFNVFISDKIIKTINNFKIPMTDEKENI
jgi:hypothetical protein